MVERQEEQMGEGRGRRRGRVRDMTAVLGYCADGLGSRSRDVYSLCEVQVEMSCPGVVWPRG